MRFGKLSAGLVLLSLIDSDLVLNLDGSRGARVRVIGHSYSQPGIIEFVSRVYSFVPGYYFEFDASDVTSMSTKTVYFINRSRSDEASPVAANFTVQWKLEGKTETNRKMQDFSKEINGKDKINLNFTQLNLEFADDEDGEYSLEMSSVIKANVSYSNGTHTKIKLDYPANFFTENVRITHPVLVRLKKILEGL